MAPTVELFSARASMNSSAMQDRLALAEFLGSHALTAYFVALPVLLLLVAGSWLLFAHGRSTYRARGWPPGLLLGVCLAIGFGVVVAAGLFFAELAAEIGVQEEVGLLDQAFSDAVRNNVSRSSLQAFAMVTHAGDSLVLAALCVTVALALVLTKRRWLAFAWVCAVGGNGTLNRTLKSIFERVRPLHEHGLVNELSWSFPSGHASGSVVAYGMLAYVVVRVAPRPWHLPAVLTAAAIAFTVGCSRVFLQVHFPSDVLAGFASGSAWLIVCISACEMVLYRRNARATNAPS